MEQALQGLPGEAYYLGDVLITIKTDQEHLKQIKAILRCLHEQEFELEKSKCVFMQFSVEYLGYHAGGC